MLTRTAVCDNFMVYKKIRDIMEYQKFENVKLPVSKLVFGTSIQPCVKGLNCDEIFDEAVNLGITIFDTARVYGKAEETLGAWMEKRGKRDKIVVLSKGGHHNPLLMKRLKEKHILYDANKSLEKLRTDFIDIYLLHRDNPAVPVDEMVETLNALRAQGKIGAFGGSNWSHERIEQANEYAYKKGLTPFTFSSPYFGLANMRKTGFGYGLLGITGQENASAREYYEKTQMPIVAYSTLGKGLFSGKVTEKRQISPLWARHSFGEDANFLRLARCKELALKKGVSVAQIAIAWSKSSALNVFPIVGASKPATLRLSVEAMSITLSADERAYLNLEK